MSEAPNGLPFSRRKRIAATCQNVNDLAREAVGCNGGLGRTAMLNHVVARPGFEREWHLLAMDHSSPDQKRAV
jgi:hypothetical protein